MWSDSASGVHGTLHVRVGRAEIKYRVAQLVCAADWLGLYESTAELRKAWAVQADHSYYTDYCYCSFTRPDELASAQNV